MNYLITDSTDECLRGLEFVQEQLEKTLEDTYNWKWVILGMHNTLQNFMVEALIDTSGMNILRMSNINKKKYIEYLRLEIESSSMEPPKEFLNNFLDLFEGIQSSEMEKFIHSKSFKATELQKNNIKKLNQLRNEFSHFIPTGLNVEISGLPSIINSCLEVIDFLVTKSGNMDTFNTRKKKSYGIIMEKLSRTLYFISNKIDK